VFLSPFSGMMEYKLLKTFPLPRDGGLNSPICLKGTQHEGESTLCSFLPCLYKGEAYLDVHCIQLLEFGLVQEEGRFPVESINWMVLYKEYHEVFLSPLFSYSRD
jgi:hypothetical protein